MGRLRIAFPYLLVLAMGAGVYWSNVRTAPMHAAPSQSTTPAAATDFTAATNTICPGCGMSVGPQDTIIAQVDGRPQRFCSTGCRDRYLADHAAEASAAPSTPQCTTAPSRLIDPVCHMEVNPAWGFSADYKGRAVYFCSRRCQERFVAAPDSFMHQRCIVCGQPVDPATALTATYLSKTYYTCSPEHRAAFKADPAGFFMHTMWGIPDWLYYVSIAVVLLVSFLMFEVFDSQRLRGWLAARFTRNQGGAGASPAGVSSGETPDLPWQGYKNKGGAGDSPAMSPRNRRILSQGGAGVSPAMRMADQDAIGITNQGAAGLSPVAALGEAPAASFHRIPGGVAHPTQPPLALAGASGGPSAAAVSLPVIAPAGVPAAGCASGDRIDLLRIPIVGSLLRSRVFRFCVQSTMVVFFLLIIVAGLFGNQSPGVNIAPLLTWTIWWGGLVVLIMFAGKAWCYMCPWDAIAGWMRRLAFWRKTDVDASLNLRWPRVVQNIWIATIMFVGLTWVEIGFGVTMRPAATAYLALGMLLMAIVSAFLFDRQSFCRYGCLVGRVSGLYAMFSGVEVRRRDPEVCRTCRSKECIRGSKSAYGCPTFQYPGGMQTNTYCIQCGECIQACSKDNLAVNLRPWGEDLKVGGRPRRDEAYLALLMLALSGFHGLTMTPVWRDLVTAIETGLPFGRVAAFTLGMAALTTLPVLIYAVLVWFSYRLTVGYRSTAAPSGSRTPGYFDYFVRYAYCVLPIALFYHLAHNLEHLLMEGQKVIVRISDPLGWGWNLLGTANWSAPPLVSLDVLWVLQVLLVAIGHVYSLWAASRITGRLFTDRRAARRGQWPMLLGMIAFSIFSLWLLKQPMQMRTSAM